MIKIEIEKKFLLSSIPNKEPDEIISIDQFYWKNKKNIWERARTYHSNINGDRYIHTIKKSISSGVSSEDEKSITLDEYNKFRDKCYTKGSDSRFLTKVRWVYNDGKLKWEVDCFNNCQLIIAELEIPTNNYKIIMPDYIKEVFLLNVTNLKQFSSKSLSIKLTV